MAVPDSADVRRDDGDAQKAIGVVPPSPPAAEEASEGAAAAPKKQKRAKKRPRTRRQIAQLRYVMIRDVESMIRSSDPAVRASAPSRARENIDRLEHLARETGDLSYRPDASMYNSLVRAHAKSGGRNAAKRAEDVLDAMREASTSTAKASADAEEGEDGIARMRPDAKTYTAVIDAWARSKDRDAPVRAERILFRMMDEAEDAARMAAADLPVPGGEVVLPTSATCDAVLNAWARRNSREGAESAERILARMEKLRDARGEADAEQQGSGASIRPTAYSYATVISAWARSRGGAEAAEKAEAVLTKMLAKGSAVRPNAVAFNAVIDAWSRSGDPRAGTKAVELLDRMEGLRRKAAVPEGDAEDDDAEDLRPDVITYNSVINALAATASSDPDAPRRAGEVFARLESDAGCPPPNVRSYNSLLKAWAKSRLPESAVKADEILRGMIDEAANKSGGDESEVRPDVVSFSTALDAWAKSDESGKATKARSLLDAMVEFHREAGPVKTSNEGGKGDRSNGDDAVSCYNAVLNACALSANDPNPDERKRALEVSVSTFRACRQSSSAATGGGIRSRPDAVTYGTMLKCVSNLVPPGQTRDGMASSLFGRCRDDGLVSTMVLGQLRRAASPGAVDELLSSAAGGSGGKAVDISDLPKEWKKNAKERGGGRRGATGGSAAAGKRGGGGKNRKGGGRHHHKQGRGGRRSSDDGDEPLLPVMRGLTETSWQSGKDV
mmetsp:Transcript_54946/g.164578  ORF Transcript_54946/g.164578 Transcript_54946/m.164578 type:complete len:728 (-) Transcript_54946:135-2318(-)